MTTTTDDFERVPPQDLNAEQCVLGSMIQWKDAIADVSEIIKEPDDFYRPAHQTIYTTILRMYADGDPVDPVTLSNRLNQDGHLERVGGASYPHTLVNAALTPSNANYHAEIVHERAILRRLVEAGMKITQMGYAGDGETREIVDAAQAELAAVVDTHDSPETGLIGGDLEQYLDDLEAFQRDGQEQGVPTGFADLDALTSGLLPGQMVIIAARPGLGKSTLALDLARHCAIERERPAAFFSLEMDRREVQNRLFSAQARIGLHHLRNRGAMTDEDWTRLARTAPRVAAAPLLLDTTPYQTVMSIKAACRKFKQQYGLDLVVIDYLQLMTSGLRRVENRQTEVSGMSRSLKLLAKELEVPVVVLCQLNRGPEQRTDKKPMVSDLRESGSLEQDADIVILVHREDAYDKETPRAGEADLIVAKHRNGPTGTITVAFQGHYSRFVDMARS